MAPEEIDSYLYLERQLNMAVGNRSTCLELPKGRICAPSTSLVIDLVLQKQLYHSLSSLVLLRLVDSTNITPSLERTQRKRETKDLVTIVDSVQHGRDESCQTR